MALSRLVCAVVIGLLLFLYFSGGPPVLARCEEHRGCVWSQSPAPAVSQCLQHHQCSLLRGPGPPLRHHHIQDIQGHPAGHPEI